MWRIGMRSMMIFHVLEYVMQSYAIYGLMCMHDILMYLSFPPPPVKRSAQPH
jgi:hypothetical protein